MKHTKLFSLLLLLLIIGGFFTKATIVPNEKHPLSYGRSDFAVFYATGKVLQENGNPYHEKTLKKTIRKYRDYNAGWRFLYPPFAGLIFIPLSMLKIKQAIWVWYFFSIACLSGIVYLLQRIREKRFSLIELSAIAALFIVYSPIFTNLRLGQVNIFLALLFTLHLFAATKKKEWLGGFAFAGLILFKIFPGILLLYYLVRGNYKMIATTIVAGIGMVLLAVLLLGSELHLHYAAVLQSLSDGIGLVKRDLVKFDNSSIYGAVLRTLNYFVEGPPFAAWQTTTAVIARIIGSMGVLIALLVAARRNRKSAPHIIEISVWIGWTLLAATEIHTQYFLFYLPLIITLLLFPPSNLISKRKSSLILIATVLIGYSFMRVLPTFIKGTVIVLVPYAFIGHVILLAILLPWLLHKREYSEEDIAPLELEEIKS